MGTRRHDEVIACAAHAFSKFGFKKTSIDEVAKAAGVAKGTVYLVADSKEDLLYQALLYEIREWNSQAAKLIDPRAEPAQTLQALSIESLRGLSDRPLVRQLFEGELHAMLPRWAERFDELTALGRRNVEEVLELGVARRRFRPGLDAAMTAQLLMDLQVSTIMFHNRPGPGREKRLLRRLHAALEMILHGISARRAP